MTPFYTNRKLAIDSVSWTPVTAPAECVQVVLRNDTSDTKIRSNEDDSDTEDTFIAGVQELIPLTRSPRGTTEPLAYLQASAGSPTVIVKYQL